jgi:hypothetical protein
MSTAAPPDQALILNRSTEALFRPFQLKSLTLPNRIVMAPMTRSLSPDGVPGADVAAYYRRRTEGGVALIITEGTFVHPMAGFHPQVPRFYGDQALAGWGRRWRPDFPAALACRHGRFARTGPKAGSEADGSGEYVPSRHRRHDRGICEMRASGAGSGI